MELKEVLVIAFLLVPLHGAAAVTLIEFDTPYIFAEIADGKGQRLLWAEFAGGWCEAIPFV
jgi:hypothetical protein